MEHLKSLGNKEDKSALWKHWTNFHDPQEEPKFSVKLTGSCLSSTERQLKEALEIEYGQYNRLRNSKSEFWNNCVVRQLVRLGETILDEKNDSEPERTGEKNDSVEPTVVQSNSQTDFERQFSQRRRNQRQKTDIPAKRKVKRNGGPINTANHELRRPNSKRQRIDSLESP